MKVATGLDVLIRTKFAALKGKRVGLVTHPAALAADGRSAIEVFSGAPNLTLAALFGPEHGLTGEAQDLVAVARGRNGALPVHTLYGETFESLTPTPAMLKGLDVLVIDLQDVGSRYYTFQATMLYCLRACAKAGLPVMVLDRPNPLGRRVEGPTLAPGFESFVGPHPICTRHGLTMGELAGLYRAEAVPDVDLKVVRYRDWSAENLHHWVLPPSPNMPTLATARVYPGLCLIEGTNVSEGRGTTRPFEYSGHPSVNPRVLVERLLSFRLRLVHFLPARFTPTFHKHAQQSCGGVFIAPGGQFFQPVRTGLALLIAYRQALGRHFIWRTEPYEFVDRHPAIDILFGSDRERKMIEAGARWQEIAKLWEPEEEEFRERRKPYLIYS